jgi:hypothetical protein
MVGDQRGVVSAQDRIAPQPINAGSARPVAPPGVVTRRLWRRSGAEGISAAACATERPFGSAGCREAVWKRGPRRVRPARSCKAAMRRFAPRPYGSSCIRIWADQYPSRPLVFLVAATAMAGAVLIERIVRRCVHTRYPPPPWRRPRASRRRPLNAPWCRSKCPSTSHSRRRAARPRTAANSVRWVRAIHAAPLA